MDVENIIYAQSIGFGMDYEHDATIDADLRLLREIPGVVAVSSTNQLPMSGSGNANGFTAEFDEDAPRHSANTYSVNEAIIDALGVKLAAGRTFRAVEIRRADDPDLVKMAPQVIITRELADKLFDGEAAVGRLLYDGIGQAAEIVGVI